jgi:hypothetical protein
MHDPGMLRVSVLLLACLFLCSCASSKRMMRISPFYESGQTLTDPDRINVWPLVYKHSDRLSVLWPIVDMDENGFAVRPLFNREKNDYSVLFPLSSFNPKRKVGWLATAYKYEDYFGAFPLFHSGKEFDYIGPWWQMEEDEAHGVFPLYGTGPGFTHVALAWREADRKTKAWASFGLFPLFSADSDGQKFWSPIYHHEFTDKKRERSALLGIARSRSWEDGRFDHCLQPLWYHKKDKNREMQVVVPFWYDKKEKGRHVSINPLFGRGVNAEGERYLTSYLGPMYIETQKGKSRDLMLGMLYHQRQTGAKSSWRLWPLMAKSNQARYPDFLYSLTLAGYRKTEHDVSWYATPLIRYEADGEQLDWNVWPLVHVNRSSAVRNFDTLVFDWWRRYEDGEMSMQTYRVPLIYSDYHDLKNDLRSSKLLFGTVNYHRDKEVNRFSVLKYLYRREQTGANVARDIFPFMKWDSKEDGYQFSFLWRLLNMEKDGAERKGHVLFVPVK